MLSRNVQKDEVKTPHAPLEILERGNILQTRRFLTGHAVAATKMKTTLGLVTAVLTLWSFSCAVTTAPVRPQERLSPQDALWQSELNWPAVTHQCRPWTRWWWLGSAVDKDNLTQSLSRYQEAGLGGVEICPIYGVKGYEGRFTDFLSPKWMEMLAHTTMEAKRLDLGVDLTTGTGWPFGGPWVGADGACKNVVHKTYTLKGGESLNESIGYVQKPMVRAIGRRVDISELKEPISTNENLQALALEQVRFEKPLPLQVLMAYSDQGQILNLTDKINEDGKLDWVAPEGNWTLYAVFQGWHGKMVERAGPGGEGNVIDHFSSEALKNYLRKFDQAYAGHNVGLLRAYFNDSYEVDDASGESNWTDDFFEEFEKRRGYDLRNHLPALFGNDSAEKNVRVLCDYRETLSELLLEQFTIPWSQWAKSKGALTRNQAHGSPANILDLYAASSIPETEGSDILKFKFASSAAHVMGKPLASSESATWLNEHFLATLAEVKQALDRLFLGGINHIFYHGTTFSPLGEDWPGWLFYASVHFGPTNSFWNDFSALNKYVARCQSFLQSGQPDNDVLVYFPIYDRWSQPGKSMLQHFAGPDGTTARDDGQAMLEGGYAFDFISDRQLQDVKFADNSLQTGSVSYKAVVLPQCQFISLKTFEKLVELARKGATIIVHNKLPSDVPGWGNLDERRNDFQKLMARINFAKVENSDIQKATVGKGQFLLGNDLAQLLSYASVKRESMVEHGLQFIRRKQANGHYYFIANWGKEPLDGWIPLQATAKSIAIFDPMFEKKGLAALRTSKQGMNEVYLQLAPGASCILRTFETLVDGPLYNYVKTTGEPQEIKGTWSVSFIEGGPELPSTIEIQELGSWTNYGGEAVKIFSGTARYTISFQKPQGQGDGWLLDLGRVCESASVRLNGKDLCTLIGPPYQILILKDLMEENNILEIKVSNLMANRIADLDRRNVNWKKFYNVNFPARRGENRGADGLFNASHWPLQDSGLIGPVRLQAMKRIIISPMPAEVKLASLFCDHIVLQQGMSVPVWGTAGPGEQVTISLGQFKQTATAGPDGKWMVRLNNLKAGGPFEMTVTGKNTITIKDIYVGEVWLCSGQSNMDMTVAREDRYWCGVQNEAEEVAAAKYPLIRQFKVPLKMTDTPQMGVEGQWVVCSPQTVGRFSATAYFFARELHKKLNVPIGLVTSSYGASTAEAWTSRKALSARPELVFLLDAYAQKKREYDPNGAAAQKYRAAMEQWEKAAAQAKAEGKDRPKEPKNPDPGQDQHNPCVLYNGMIAPLVPYAIRGVIWYQGESSGPTAGKYFNLMETLIQDWRQILGQGDFSFLFVQLANNGKLTTQPNGGGWMAAVREGQLQTLAVTNTGMAVAIDIGDANNIHPKNKQEVGFRLALAARALAYHESIPYSGPIYESMTIEGSAIRLRFKQTDGGLVAKGDKLIGFGIAGEDSNFVWADAKIDGDTIIVSSPQVAKPVAVRYGWADNPPVNLYNKAGLPASPFRTDGAVTRPAALDVQKEKK